MKYIIRIITGLSILWMMRKNSNFLYPTMNLYFTFCTVAVLLFACSLFNTIRTKTIFPCGTLDLCFLLWMMYIGIHSLVLPAEHYAITYLLCSGLYYLACVMCFRSGFFTLKGLKNTFLAVATIECAVCGLQYLGRIESYSRLFPVTGTLVDPNLTALLIAWAVPFVIYSLVTNSRKRIGMGLLLLLFLSTLLLLKCRTAFLCVLFSFLFIIAGEKKWGVFFLRQSLRHKVITVLLTGVLLSGVSAGLYFLKQDSADGRLFIWKVSGTMIQEKPFTGYGYGLFEKSYNPQQEKELAKKETTTTERQNARFTLLAFNDILEQTVSGGLAGGLIFILILGVATGQSFRKKDSSVIACCIGILISIFVNFVVQSVVLWMAALTVFAYVSEGSKPLFRHPHVKTGFSITTVSVLCLVTLFCSFRIGKTYFAQIHLKEALALSRENPESARTILKKYLPDAGTSECYLRYYAKFLLQQGNYEEAKKLLEQAGKYTSHPSVKQELEYIKAQKSEQDIQ